MIIPKNGHILIEPLKHESFMSSQKETYEEVGLVVDYDKGFILNRIDYGGGQVISQFLELNIGDKVFFDSWLAAKFPKSDNEFFWLVKWEDVRAIEHEDTIPK